VLIEGSKISKSLGNGIRLQEIVEKGFSLEAFRLHVLESHYRSQSKFSWDSLQAAQNRLNDLKAMAALQWQTVPTVHDQTTFTYGDVAEELAGMLAEDLHTETALAYLSEMTKQVLAIGVADIERSAFIAMLQGIDELLGTKLSTIQDISNEHKQLIAQRQRVREVNDWAKADEYRNQLATAGVGVRDNPDGSTSWFPLS
jgi:cysteinyl-tRNA synthetase